MPSRGVKPPRGFKQTEYLRKDHFFLFERFYYFLEAKQEHGLIGESDKVDDRAFVKRMESYFMRTALGAIDRTGLSLHFYSSHRK